MGGDLTNGPGDRAPTFMAVASKDPNGANLDRIQIVKGWLDGQSEVQEKVYDVAWSGDRVIEPVSGRLPAVGSTVDAKTATYANTIGVAELAVVWTDPDFDMHERAFYYVRVLEIPIPRWSTKDAVYFDVEVPAGTPLLIQDRAYTSPIWYTP